MICNSKSKPHRFGDLGGIVEAARDGLLDDNLRITQRSRAVGTAGSASSAAAAEPSAIVKLQQAERNILVTRIGLDPGEMRSTILGGADKLKEAANFTGRRGGLSSTLDPDGESLLRILGGGEEGRGALQASISSQDHSLKAVITAASHPHQVWHVMSADPYVRALRYSFPEALQL